MKTVIFNKSERFFVTKIKILNNKHILKIDIKNLTEINKCMNVQINSSNDNISKQQNKKSII